MNDFFGVLASGFGASDGQEAEYVFVNLTPSDIRDATERAGALARLLSEGGDWDEAGRATGYALVSRSRADRLPGVGIELAEGVVVRLDIMGFARDPIGALLRMAREAGQQG